MAWRAALVDAVVVATESSVSAVAVALGSAAPIHRPRLRCAPVLRELCSSPPSTSLQPRPPSAAACRRPRQQHPTPPFHRIRREGPYEIPSFSPKNGARVGVAAAGRAPSLRNFCNLGSPPPPLVGRRAWAASGSPAPASEAPTPRRWERRNFSACPTPRECRPVLSSSTLRLSSSRPIFFSNSFAHRPLYLSRHPPTAAFRLYQSLLCPPSPVATPVALSASTRSAFGTDLGRFFPGGGDATASARFATSVAGPGGSSAPKIASETAPKTALKANEVYSRLRTKYNLDFWAIVTTMLALAFGRDIAALVRQADRSGDDYGLWGVPADDPAVEHAVRIVREAAAEVAAAGDGDGERRNNGGFARGRGRTMRRAERAGGATAAAMGVPAILPEEDARRILRDLLASEAVRSTFAGAVARLIESDRVRVAATGLVRDVRDDLASDPETTAQVINLVSDVLNDGRVQSAARSLVLKLANDEEVCRELAKVVVKLGDDDAVLRAVQALLTTSAHRTLNDSDVLDHSMEFAADVVGDDVVQRTGGEALRNTVGYAVQPSGKIVLVWLGTALVAFAFRYLGRNNGGVGGGGGGGGAVGSVATDIRVRDGSIPAPPTASAFFSLVAASHLLLEGPSLVLSSVRFAVMAVISFPRQAAERVTTTCKHAWASARQTAMRSIASLAASPGLAARGVANSAARAGTSISAFPSRLAGDCSRAVVSAASGSVGAVRRSVARGTLTVTSAVSTIVGAVRCSVARGASVLSSFARNAYRSCDRSVGGVRDVAVSTSASLVSSVSSSVDVASRTVSHLVPRTDDAIRSCFAYLRSAPAAVSVWWTGTKNVFSDDIMQALRRYAHL